MTQSITPGILINGRLYHPTGEEWLMVFASAGCEWAVAELKRRAQTSPHSHKCGHGAAGLSGCGRVWSHDPATSRKGGLVAHHLCPDCGKGPWMKVYTESKP